VRLLEEEYEMEAVAFGFKPSGTVSNYAILSTRSWLEARGTHHIGVHVGMDSPVRARVIPRGDKDGIALGNRDHELVDRVRFDISL